MLEVPVRSGDTTAKVLDDIMKRAGLCNVYHPDNLQLYVLTWNREVDQDRDVNQIRDVNFGMHKISGCNGKMSLVVTLSRRPAAKKKTTTSATADKLKRIISSSTHTAIGGAVHTLQLVCVSAPSEEEMSQKPATKQNSKAKKETMAERKRK